MTQANLGKVRSITILLALVASACGSGGSGGTKPTSTPVIEPGKPITGLVPRPSAIDETCKTALAGPYDDSLKVPDKVVATPDDNTAQIQWGGPLTSNGDDVAGYRVCWGPKGQDPIYGVLTTHRVTQLFGVQNGAEFEAYVQSVDGMGNASKPSDPITFTGDNTRVEALRQKMTGFFDDFNLKDDSPLNDLKWNTAYATCNDATVNGAFVQDLHAVNMIGNHSYLPGSKWGCDRDQNINRTRAVFDFSGREGLITFDFDGSDGDRNTWYVDVFPWEGNDTDLVDITSHVTFDPGVGHPGRFLRFSQAGNVFLINRFDDKGKPGKIWKAETGFMYPDIATVPTVMRHWELRVSKDKDTASITINGIKVMEATDLGLDFDKGIVTWDQFNYNPAKIGRPWVMFSFDNFGFDGPQLQPIVHNYKVNLLGDDAVKLGGANPDGKTSGTTTIPIPDDIGNAKSAKFYYTISNNGYRHEDTDTFTINGTEFKIPVPTSPTGITTAASDNPLIDDFRGFATVADIPPSILVPGDNTIEWHAAQTQVRNLHIELNYDGDAPKYTQPVDALPAPAVPQTVIIGPSMIVGRVGDIIDNLFSDNSFRVHPQPASGKIQIALKLDNIRPVLASGRNLGIVKAELLIDQKVVGTIMTNAASPAPQNDDLAFDVDTTTLSNGMHEVFGVAYDAAGTKGRPMYNDPERDENGLYPENYAPIMINVSN